jgi:2',3'-cyclic-nucleotide 2'-phosphodiesterase / 3'-nucleotidase
MNKFCNQKGVIVLFCFFIFPLCSGQQPRKLVLLETTDVHGMVLPYDYIEKKASDASLAGVEGYIRQSGLKKDEMILLDNGDNLQGQPPEYYYNFIDTTAAHINSRIMNYMQYDACTVGNHDIEAGHSVYDRVRKEYKFPLLAANAVIPKSGKPYFEPFTIIKRKGLKIAVFGMVTPSIPDWLPPELYSGMEFRDMVETARKWMPVILGQKPDLVVGLFHSGWDKNYDPVKNNYYRENGSAAVAYYVPGFDVIFTGHDHGTACEKIVNRAGDTVLVLDGGSHAEKIARADIKVYTKKKGSRPYIISSGTLINVSDYRPDSEYLAFCSGYDKTVKSYVDKVIGESTSTISSRESYFGPSAFTGIIHSIQLEISGADVSFAAPLSFDVEIPVGKITVGDMFKLYRFENMLYTMSLTGSEIQKYLEFSYSGWFNTMKSADDHLIEFKTGTDGKPLLTGGRARLKNQAYNFDSAAGIDYTVDVSKPAGQRVTIKGFSDGRPFDPLKRYWVAVNSYRGNGGGGHFFDGAGLSREDLRARLISSTEKDMRYYIMKYIESMKIISPKPVNNWKVIPEEWVVNAKKRDYMLMFGRSDADRQK